MKYIPLFFTLFLGFACSLHAQLVATKLDLVHVLAYLGPQTTSSGDFLSYDFENRMGELSVTGEFVQTSSLPQRFFSSEITSELLSGAALTNRYLMMKSNWDAMEDAIPGYYSTHFKRSTAAYLFKGSSYYIVSTTDAEVPEPRNPYSVLGLEEDAEYPEPNTEITFDTLYFFLYPSVYDFSRQDWFYFDPGSTWVFSYNKKEWYYVRLLQSQ